MDTLRNISIIFLFFSVILLTVYFTRINYIEDDTMRFKNKYIDLLKKIRENSYYNRRPTRVYRKMFVLPSVWMGYADRSSLDVIKKPELLY